MGAGSAGTAVIASSEAGSGFSSPAAKGIASPGTGIGLSTPRAEVNGSAGAGSGCSAGASPFRDASSRLRTLSRDGAIFSGSSAGTAAGAGDSGSIHGAGGVGNSFGVIGGTTVDGDGSNTTLTGVRTTAVVFPLLPSVGADNCCTSGSIQGWAGVDTGRAGAESLACAGTCAATAVFSLAGLMLSIGRSTCSLTVAAVSSCTEEQHPPARSSPNPHSIRFAIGVHMATIHPSRQVRRGISARRPMSIDHLQIYRPCDEAGEAYARFSGMIRICRKYRWKRGRLERRSGAAQPGFREPLRRVLSKSGERNLSADGRRKVLCGSAASCASLELPR